MELNYSLTFDDFMQNQLYNASKSKRIQNQKRKNLFLIYLSLIVLVVTLYDSNENSKNLVAFSIILIVAIFYPVYLKNRYYNHYKKYLEENVKNKVGIIASLKFTEEGIETSDETGESKINYSNLEEINEIENYFFLKLKTSESIILPKSRISKFENPREYFKRT
ncbi:MAG: hypothetical protein EOO46_11955 [Flavobacterium sp.]|nr:MAG: hypothetical protein EOO46_11955 [Flavobacterium sp.]